MEIVKIKEKYIELLKFLKFIKEISTGGEISCFLEENNVLINEKKAKFKRQKLYDKSVVKINNKTYQIKTEF